MQGMRVPGMPALNSAFAFVTLWPKMFVKLSTLACSKVLWSAHTSLVSSQQSYKLFHAVHSPLPNHMRVHTQARSAAAAERAHDALLAAGVRGDEAFYNTLVKAFAYEAEAASSRWNLGAAGMPRGGGAGSASSAAWDLQKVCPPCDLRVGHCIGTSACKPCCTAMTRPHGADWVLERGSEHLP